MFIDGLGGTGKLPLDINANYYSGIENKGKDAERIKKY
jgi:hypothetical protein